MDGRASDAIDGGPRDVELDEGSGSGIAAVGFTCSPQCGATQTYFADLHWFREFELQDPASAWNITGPLQINSVKVGCGSARGNPNVTVNIYSYTAPDGSPRFGVVEG